jgi:drug/metabolite transporter (DMT)-like permease
MTAATERVKTPAELAATEQMTNGADAAEITNNTKGRSLAMTLAISYILISVLGGAIGQLMLKNGMNKFGEVTLSLGDVPQLLMKLALNPWVVGGLFLYACGTIFWLAGISRVDLSYAYPFASLSYVVMLLVAWQLFDEQITLPRIIGTVVIATGVLIVSRG